MTRSDLTHGVIPPELHDVSQVTRRRRREPQERPPCAPLVGRIVGPRQRPDVRFAGTDVVAARCSAVVVARWLDAEDWGVFSAFLGLSIALGVFIEFGLATWLLRDLSALFTSRGELREAAGARARQLGARLHRHAYAPRRDGGGHRRRDLRRASRASCSRSRRSSSVRRSLRHRERARGVPARTAPPRTHRRRERRWRSTSW